MTQSATLSFHPNFTEPSSAEIFQAEDGTCFRFKISTLALFSSFFRDLVDIATLQPEDKEDTVIPLPSATRDALAVSLDLINSLFQEVPKCAPSTDILLEFDKYSNCRMLRGIITIVDAYDLPIIGRRYIEVGETLKSPENRLKDGFVMAAILNDKVRAKQILFQTILRNSHLGPDRSLILAENAKEYLDKWDDVRESWRLEVIKFTNAIAEQQCPCSKKRRCYLKNKSALLSISRSFSVLLQNQRLDIDLGTTKKIYLCLARSRWSSRTGSFSCIHNSTSFMEETWYSTIGAVQVNVEEW